MIDIPVWLSLSATVASIVSFVVAYGSYRQGVRNSRNVESKGATLSVNVCASEHATLQCICAPFRGRELRLPVRLTVQNRSPFTARNVRLVAEIPRRFYSKDAPPFTASAIPDFSAEVASWVDTTFTYTCTIPALHPEQECEIIFRLEIRPARGRNDAPPHVVYLAPDGQVTHLSYFGGLPTPDELDVVDVSLLEKDAFRIDCTVFREDARPTQRTFHFRVHDRSSLSIAEYFRGVNAYIRELALVEGKARTREKLFPGWGKDAFQVVELIEWPDRYIERRDGDIDTIKAPALVNTTVGFLSHDGYYIPGIEIGRPPP